MKVTYPDYATLFAELGWGSTIAGILLALLIPFLRKFIQVKETPAGLTPEPLVATNC